MFVSPGMEVFKTSCAINQEDAKIIAFLSLFGLIQAENQGLFGLLKTSKFHNPEKLSSPFRLNSAGGDVSIPCGNN
jgi:hypothetical protein